MYKELEPKRATEAQESGEREEGAGGGTKRPKEEGVLVAASQAVVARLSEDCERSPSHQPQNMLTLLASATATAMVG